MKKSHFGLIFIASIVIAFVLSNQVYYATLNGPIPQQTCSGDGVGPEGLCDVDGWMQHGNALQASTPVFFKNLGLLMLWPVVAGLINVVKHLKEKREESVST